jgi:hypothetical protein
MNFDYRKDLFMQNNQRTRELRAKMVLHASNVNLNMDLIKMRGASLMSFEEGKPILLKIRAIMPV